MAANGKPGPWLIAGWPGMGSVAVIAAGYLVRTLGMREIARLPSGSHFDINEVEVDDGIIVPARIPRGIFFRWDNPAGRDLIVFMGEAQPESRVYAYANELLDMALSFGVERVITFASMASGLHPSEDPKVTGVATDGKTLSELHRAEVKPMKDGQIGGLNGVLLGAAAARGVPGFSLLAEIPFFAAAVPNPKAARVALSVFSILAGIDVSLDELNKHASAMDRALIEALEKIQRGEGQDEEPEGAEGPEEEDRQPEEPPGEARPGDRNREPREAPDHPSGPRESDREMPPVRGEPGRTEPGKIDYATRQRIERLFREAHRDKRKAVHLKDELDRLGIFKHYEDRFLDLFRRAE
jgi:predicted ATP-grasp superfamily ATP-dependent carboligase